MEKFIPCKRYMYLYKDSADLIYKQDPVGRKILNTYGNDSYALADFYSGDINYCFELITSSYAHSHRFHYILSNLYIHRHLVCDPNVNKNANITRSK